MRNEIVAALPSPPTAALDSRPGRPGGGSLWPPRSPCRVGRAACYGSKWGKATVHRMMSICHVPNPSQSLRGDSFLHSANRMKLIHDICSLANRRTRTTNQSCRVTNIESRIDELRKQNKVTRMMRVEAPRQFLPNVRSSGLALRLALAKEMNSEQI